MKRLHRESRYLPRLPGKPHSNKFVRPSDGPGHGLELDHRAVLLLRKVVASVLDVDVVPGEHLVHRPLALAVEGNVDVHILERPPPEPGVEMLGPGVEPRPSAPGF